MHDGIGHMVHPPGADTPWSDTPPRSDAPRSDTPQKFCIFFHPRYGQCVGGTHPTGMHSCFENFYCHLSNGQLSNF